MVPNVLYVSPPRQTKVYPPLLGARTGAGQDRRVFRVSTARAETGISPYHQHISPSTRLLYVSNFAIPFLLSRVRRNECDTGVRTKSVSATRWRREAFPPCVYLPRLPVKKTGGCGCAVDCRRTAARDRSQHELLLVATSQKSPKLRWREQHAKILKENERADNNKN